MYPLTTVCPRRTDSVSLSAQALAGKYRRNLCILQPTDPKFTDEKLQTAIQDAPNRSIIVLEVRNLSLTPIHYTLRTLHPPYTLHPTPYTLHPTPYTLQPAPYTLHPTPYTLYPTPHTLHPTDCTLLHTPHYCTPYTLHPTPFNIHPTPYTPHPTSCILHPTPNTQRYQPSILIPSLSTLHSHASTLNPKPRTLNPEPTTCHLGGSASVGLVECSQVDVLGR